jgi:hypothetical protein
MDISTVGKQALAHGQDQTDTIGWTAQGRKHIAQAVRNVQKRLAFGATKHWLGGASLVPR